MEKKKNKKNREEKNTKKQCKTDSFNLSRTRPNSLQEVVVNLVASRVSSTLLKREIVAAQ